MGPGLPAQVTAVRISSCCNAVGLNERFLTPTFNYSLGKDVVMELKATRDQLEQRCALTFSSVPIALREGLIHLFSTYLPKAQMGQVLGTGVNRDTAPSTWSSRSSTERQTITG